MSDVTGFDFTASADRLQYLMLVQDECQGKAPAGTADKLAAEPVRWKAALATALEDIDRQISTRRDQPWLSQAHRARQHFLARLADVKHLEKTTNRKRQLREKDGRVADLVDTLRAIERVLDDPATDDTAACERIGELVDGAIHSQTERRAS